VKIHFASHLGRISFGKHDEVDVTVDVPKNMFADIPLLELRESAPKTERRRARS
jgi:hypothetical protein